MWTAGPAFGKALTETEEEDKRNKRNWRVILLSIYLFMFFFFTHPRYHPLFFFSFPSPFLLILNFLLKLRQTKNMDQIEINKMPLTETQTRQTNTKSHFATQFFKLIPLPWLHFKRHPFIQTQTKHSTCSYSSSSSSFCSIRSFFLRFLFLYHCNSMQRWRERVVVNVCKRAGVYICITLHCSVHVETDREKLRPRSAILINDMLINHYQHNDEPG